MARARCDTPLVGFACQGKDIVFRFTIEYYIVASGILAPRRNKSIFYMRIFERCYFGLFVGTYLRLVIEL